MERPLEFLKGGSPVRRKLSSRHQERPARHFASQRCSTSASVSWQAWSLDSDPRDVLPLLLLLLLLLPYSGDAEDSVVTKAWTLLDRLCKESLSLVFCWPGWLPCRTDSLDERWAQSAVALNLMLQTMTCKQRFVAEPLRQTTGCSTGSKQTGVKFALLVCWTRAGGR